MSLFQCDNCGCAENSALTEGYLTLEFLVDDPEVIKSYKEILGLKEDEEFGNYCSACCPIWFNENGQCGLGKNPKPKPGEGMWHGQFDRVYLPKGKFETAPNGNLRHKANHDEDFRKYAIRIEKA